MHNTEPLTIASPVISKKVWLADLTHTAQVVASDVMPTAIGGIATFAESRLQMANRIRLFKYPEKLAAALDVDVPDVIGFSNYCSSNRANEFEIAGLQEWMN